jgi:hypothetical protein
MGSNALLAGFPEVTAVDIFQGSYAKPGQVVVDTLVLGSVNPSILPRTTGLILEARSIALYWNDLRITKAPRQYGAFMRTVFEDSRWKLADVVLAENYNSRDCEGRIYPATEKTIAQLVQILATASGLTIATGAVPTFKPDASWRGLTGTEAMDDLLRSTGCRMVYDPATLQYVVSSGGSGPIPSLSERLFRPVANAKYAQIQVRTAPITYEKKFNCNAVVWNEANETEVVNQPERIFNNFGDVATVRLRSKYIHSAMRLWKPDDTNVSLLGRRALTVAPGDDDSTYAAMVFTVPNLADVPKYGHLTQPFGRAPNALSLTGGGKIFQCEQAHVQIDDDGAIKTTAEILSAYHLIVAGEPERSVLAASPGGAGVLVLDFDWIRPVSSTESDIGATLWEDIHAAVFTAISFKYSYDPQHVTVPTLLSHGAPGALGGVRYFLKLGHQADSRTVLAFNFDPADARMM